MRLELWNCIHRIPWRRRISPWRLAAAAGCALAIYFAVCAVVGAVLHFCATGDRQQLWTIAVLGGIFAQLPAGAGLVLCCLAAPPAKRLLAAKLGIRPLRRRDWKVIGACVAANLLLCGPVTGVWELMLNACDILYRREQELALMIADGSPLLIALLLVGAVIVAPVVEEIGFRRVLFGLFRPLGAWPAILMSCAVFSLVHGFLLGIPGLFLLGFLFQYAYLRTRNLAAAVLLHMVVNLIATAAALIEPLFR